jgi:hypothetical protein
LTHLISYQTYIFPKLKQWATSAEEDTSWEQDYWKGAILRGLNENPTPQNIEDLLGAHSIYEYYCLIAFGEK